MKKTVLLSVFALFAAGTAFAQKARTISAGEITSNTTWYADTIYTLDGYVYVKNNATLTIQPGTLIKGNAANKSSLIITRNGMINAAGTPMAPIVFTSSKAKGQRATSDWGGLIILGKAPINQPDLPSGPSVAIAAAEPGGQRAIEGDLDNANGDGLYGGTDANHSSGVIRFVRLEFGGVVITPGNEINGLTLGGVGKGTQMDHIQVTQANDDGFEWFGGNVEAKYLISHRNIDDDFDTDFGFSGKVQFGLIIRDSNWYDRGSGPTTNGFESDNDGSGSALTPITSAIFSNVTVMGPLAQGIALSGSLAGNSFNNGARIRRNSSESIFNSVFMGWPNALFVDGTASGDNFNNGSLGFKNNVMAGNLNALNNASTGLNVRQTIVTNGTDTSAGLTSVYNDPFNYNNPDFGFKAGSVAATGASFADTKLTDPFFTATTYRGAFGANNWTNGWTNFNPAEADYTDPIGSVTWTGAGNDAAICSGASTTIGTAAAGGSGRFTYMWMPAAGLSSTAVASPVANPTTTTTYIVAVTDNNSGNTWRDTIVVTVNPSPVADFTFANGAGALVNFTSTSTNATSYKWNFGDGDSATTQNTAHTFKANGIFNVRLTVTNGNCTNTITKLVQITGINSPIKNVPAGEITSNTTWYADTIYELGGYVYVKNNATLTIQPGTIIKGGVSANKGALIITRNGMINAAGTKNSPIIFTSSKAKGQRATSDWGGLIILGKAPINQPDLPSGPSVAIAAAEPGGQRAIEGDLDNANGDGLYGGTDANHSSGVIRFVRLEFGGVVITPGNEINGLTMGGVGKGTQMDHIQVTQANDDGFEWFGGNVEAKYLISHRNIDDDFDTDFGFSGKVQFGLIIRDSSWYDRGAGPTTNGFESDNDGSGSALTPITSAIFSNVTVMGPLATGVPLSGSLAGNSFNNGARIRRNSSESIFNSVFMGWPNALFVDGTASGDNFNNGSLGFKSNVLAGNLNAINNSSTGLNVRQTIVANGTDTSAGLTSVYNDPFNYNNPDFGFKAGSVAATGASFADAKLTDPFFTATTYRGAFGGNTKWTDCWTNFNPAEEDYNAGPYVQQGAVASFNAAENDKEVTFTNGSIGNKLSFAWDFGVASSTNDTSSLQNPVYMYADTGTYLVRLTVTSPCGDSTITKQVKVAGSVGMEEAIDNVGKVTIYPNPASTSATVEFELTEGTNVSVNMYDLSGRLVKSVPSQFMMTGNNTINIETSDLTAGMYFTNITTDKSNKTYRLIIIK